LPSHGFATAAITLTIRVGGAWALSALRVGTGKPRQSALKNKSVLSHKSFGVVFSADGLDAACEAPRRAQSGVDDVGPNDEVSRWGVTCNGAARRTTAPIGGRRAANRRLEQTASPAYAVAVSPDDRRRAGDPILGPVDTVPGLPHHACDRPAHGRSPSRRGGEQPHPRAVVPFIPASKPPFAELVRLSPIADEPREEGGRRSP
jgi:hypothetical protein